MNKKIELLHPVRRSEAQALYEEANRRLTGRAKMLITDTLRTFAYQDWLYAKGRTQPGKKVTNARGGQSLHNYGLAIDFALLIDGKTASWEDLKDFDGDRKADWMEIVEVFEAAGWEWGGRWKGFPDRPHLQKTSGNDWRTLLKRKQEGKMKDGYVMLSV